MSIALKAEGGRQRSGRAIVTRGPIVSPLGSGQLVDAVVKSYKIQTCYLKELGGPSPGQTFATLGTPTISIIEVPTQAGHDYYIGFVTFITSNGWYFQFETETQQLAGHCELFDAKGLEIHSVPVFMNVDCTMRDAYLSAQTLGVAEFFARTDYAAFAWDASYPWYQCNISRGRPIN